MLETVLLNALEHLLPSVLNMEEGAVTKWCNSHGELGVLILAVWNAFSGAMTPAGTVNTAVATKTGNVGAVVSDPTSATVAQAAAALSTVKAAVAVVTAPITVPPVVSSIGGETVMQQVAQTNKALGLNPGANQDLSGLVGQVVTVEDPRTGKAVTGAVVDWPSPSGGHYYGIANPDGSATIVDNYGQVIDAKGINVLDGALAFAP